MDKTKKVFILQGKIDSPISGYDHVFSFRANPADSFPDDYLSEQEADSLYNLTYDTIHQYLENHPYKSLLSYRGVDLLWCFKKVFFEYAFLGVIRTETLRRVMAAKEGSDFFISKYSADLRGPLLIDILKVTDLGNDKRIHFSDRLYPMEQSRHAERYGERKIPLPSFNILGDLKRCTLASCYDFGKAKSLLARLRPHGCALFSSSQPRRMMLRALLYRFPLCQLIYNANVAKPYLEKTKEFVATLNQCQIFKDMALHSLNLELLFAAKTKRVFEASLPRLLFEIEGMHRFFTEAKALKSVLLDEDVTPSRRAFCSIARGYSVRTFVECHGLLGGKHGFVPPAADKMFVWGQAQKNKLVRWGCPEDKIIVSGYSRYGRYRKMATEAVRREVVKRQKLDSAKKIILLAFPPITHSWFIIFERQMRRTIVETLGVVLKVCQTEDQAQFVLKLHPADDDKKFYQDWVKKRISPEKLVVVEDYDSLLLAKAADFLIVLKSTYAVDGFAMDKPVIYLRDDSQMLQEFQEYSIFTYVKTPQELHVAVMNLIQNPEFRPRRWEEAKRECLNETGPDAEEFIAACLTGDGHHPGLQNYEPSDLRTGASVV